MPDIDFAARRTWFGTYLDALEAEGARTMVADEEGEPAGFVTIDIARGTIDQLAVHPARQGRGIASRLMRAAKLLSPSCLDLTVNRDNGPARRFYARHGFAEIGSGTNPNSGLPILMLRWTLDRAEAAASPAQDPATVKGRDGFRSLATDDRYGRWRLPEP